MGKIIINEQDTVTVLPRLQVSHPEDTVFWVLAKMEAAKFV
jgi:hypothetical protein